MTPNNPNVWTQWPKSTWRSLLATKIWWQALTGWFKSLEDGQWAITIWPSFRSFWQTDSHSETTARPLQGSEWSSDWFGCHEASFSNLLDHLRLMSICYEKKTNRSKEKMCKCTFAHRLWICSSWSCFLHCCFCLIFPVLHAFKCLHWQTHVQQQTLIEIHIMLHFHHANCSSTT